ncbi:MAG: AAA family ATPase [Bacteroidales bacterium]
MIRIFEDLAIIEQSLQEFDKNIISDYFISLKINQIVDVYLLSESITLDALIKKNDIFGSNRVNVIIINKEELEFDPLYQSIFSKKEKKVELGLVRRHETLVNNTNIIRSTDEIPCNVVTFYSYKGGMGRSTTMISYAMHLALNNNRKVIILDFDLEAPGYLNFFDINVTDIKSGLVEYLMDFEYCGEEIIKDRLEDYIINIDPKFYGKGNIWVMPAGNLTYMNTEKSKMPHIQHYLQGLARLDISSSDEMVEKLKKLFKLLTQYYSLSANDFILIDSRTGINDILPVTAFHLSNAIVSFFGSSEQTKPGLFLFLQQIEKIKQKENIGQPINLLLVNSILSDRKDIKNKFHSHFYTLLDEYNTLLEDNHGNEFNQSIFPLERNRVLAEVGVKHFDNAEDNGNELITLIKENSFLDYNESKKEFTDFKDLFSHLDQIFNKRQQEKMINANPMDLRKEVLEGFQKNMPNIFAEQDEQKDVLLFYYRDCMKALFDKKSIVIEGFKGTGKTYLYKSLRNSNIESASIRKRLMQDYSIELDRPTSYVFVDVIQIRGDETLNKRFPINNSQINEINSFDDFWIAYFWLSIMVDRYSNKLPELEMFESKLEKYILEIIESRTERSRNKLFLDTLLSEEVITQIDDELVLINDFLIEKNIYIVLMFDQLDRLVAPKSSNGIFENMHDFERIVSPLVNYWVERNKLKRYSNFLPKIFIRTDLFTRRIKGLNNYLFIKNNNTQNIEWEPNEVYSFLFNLIFHEPNAKKSFFTLMRHYGEYSNEVISNLEKSIENNKFKQVPLERNIIEPLLNTLFGQNIYAVTSKSKANNWEEGQKLGNPYDYFFKNFSNANKTISLRPVISLIKGAVSLAVNSSNEKEYPIINSLYTTNRAERDRVVQEHLDDLVKESGDKIKIIVDELRKDSAKQYRTIPLPQQDLKEFLNIHVINKNEIIFEKDTSDDLIEQMQDIGLIIERVMPFGKVYYFAEMYKYWMQFSVASYGSFSERDINTNPYLGRPIRKIKLDENVQYYYGIVINKQKGFGTVTVDGYEGEVTFYYKDLDKEDPYLTFNEDIKEGITRVKFQYGNNEKGKKSAICVQLIEDSDPNPIDLKMITNFAEIKKNVTYQGVIVKSTGENIFVKIDQYKDIVKIPLDNLLKSKLGEISEHKTKIWIVKTNENEYTVDLQFKFNESFKGIIKYMNRDKGYGIISMLPNMNTLYFKINNIEEISKDNLIEGDNVKFKIKNIGERSNLQRNIPFDINKIK